MIQNYVSCCINFWLIKWQTYWNETHTVVKSSRKSSFKCIARELTSGLAFRIQHRRGMMTESERGICGLEFPSTKSVTIFHNISEVRSKVIHKQRFWPASGTKHLRTQLASVKGRIYADGNRMQEQLIVFCALICCVQDHVRLAESLIHAENSSKTFFFPPLPIENVANSANT